MDFLLRQPVQIKFEQIFFTLVRGVHNCIVGFLTVRFHFSGFVPVWALAVWAALRFVPASRALAFLFRCLIFFDLYAWFVVFRPEDFRNLFAVAFGPNDVTGEEKRRETDGHKTPEGEHLPIQMIGFVAARGALTVALDWASPRILDRSMDFRT
ncbi:MAG: hypothetical protein ACLQAH_00645 [Limisphaerales bacterium]